MVETLNEIGRRTLDLGVSTTFHPHTGTPVETREEIDRVMSSVDPRYVGFAPDTGQIQKGGSDAVEVLRTYLPLVRHVHLKDWVGGVVQRNADGTEVDRTGYADYVPVGSGVVDISGIVALLDGAGYDGWWMVELDGTAQAPRPPPRPPSPPAAPRWRATVGTRARSRSSASAAVAAPVIARASTSLGRKTSSLSSRPSIGQVSAGSWPVSAEVVRPSSWARASSAGTSGCSAC